MKILCYAIVVLISGQIGPGYTATSALSNSNGNGRSGRCGKYQFMCHNGQCIDSLLLCDGKADCIDKSDETREECSSIVCPSLTFRCTYGACVDGDAVCDGKKDCFDNSDELLPNCAGGNLANNTSAGSRCTENQFRCDNGQCIEDTSLCDGAVDCADRSDETLAKCRSFKCPQIVFRCKYGACIDGDLKCNGVADCADNSDEDPALCNRSTERPTPTPGPTPDVVYPTDGWSQPSWRHCPKPPQPVNGRWKLHSSQCRNKIEDCDVQQGFEFQPGTHLVYNCNPGYKIKGSVHASCGFGGKWLNIPECIAIRCDGLNSISTIARSCTYQNNYTSCDPSVPPGTVAILECRNGYTKDATFLTTQGEVVTCNGQGSWEPDPIGCVPACGVPNVHLTPTITNGMKANIAEFPWHATLYMAREKGGPKEFICGATIIKENLLITAAHCIYDEGNKEIYDPQLFFVATGNVFRDYDSPFHDVNSVKKAAVKSIYIICQYKGLEGNYDLDIAILEIAKPFVLSSILRPICLDPDAKSDQRVLEYGNLGRVAGFGRTSTSATSFILQTLSVPYIPYNQCTSRTVGFEEQKLITVNKFCAGYTNGSAVCDGDSGGGLVFKSGQLWYLRGIVSAGIGTVVIEESRTCNSHMYSLYTRVSNHIQWIQNVILKLKTSGSNCPITFSDEQTCRRQTCR